MVNRSNGVVAGRLDVSAPLAQNWLNILTRAVTFFMQLRRFSHETGCKSYIPQAEIAARDKIFHAVGPLEHSAANNPFSCEP